MDTLALFLLLSGSVLVTAVARRRGWPAPLIVVIFALAVSFLPGVPSFSLDPELTLTVVLPPLLYTAALEVSLVNVREVRSSVWRLGVWLVIVSAAVVGAVLLVLIPGISVAAALLIGAIVAPPDAVSALAIGRKVGLPRHVMTILTGESLINDASSLTLVKVSLAVLGGAALTLSDDLFIFAIAVVVGVAVGAALGTSFLWLRRQFRDPPVQVLFGLSLPFFAYVAAEHLSGSGVLAVVTAGLIVGYNAPKADYMLRLQERPVWDALNLLLEGFVFALIGLQFHTVVADIQSGEQSLGWCIGIAAAVFAACIMSRFAFVFATSAVGNFRARHRQRLRIRLATEDQTYTGLRGLRRRHLMDRTGEIVLSWQEMFVISWAGMRGVVTLAAAVSVPAVLDTGARIPAHDIIVFIAFVVTVASLLLHGMTLPLVVRWLGVQDPGQGDRDHEAKRHFLRASLAEAARSLGEDVLRDPARYPGVNAQTIATIRSRISRDEEAEEEVERSGEGPTETPVDPRLPAIDGSGYDSQLPHPTEIPGNQPLSSTENQPHPSPDQGSRPATRATKGVTVLNVMASLQRDLLHRRREILSRERDAGTLDDEVVREILLSLDAAELALDHRSV